MKVFKFGGASVKDAAGVKNVTEIIRKFGIGKTLVVVSAMGKTTNALEEVVYAYFHDTGEAASKIEALKQNHFVICQELFEDDNHPVFDKINNLLVELDWQIEEQRKSDYNYVYDQIVSLGELLSSMILSEYALHVGIVNLWLDVRDVLKTDDTYREGVVQWDKTQQLVEDKVKPVLEKKLIVTQGFLGCTSDNCTTTLGREGSDYTAAIFANMLHADSQTIWKDVPGVMSGDPRKFDDAEFIEELTYMEAVEMTFYGASVIHPKTIKPLQNKNIPLIVKSFVHPEDKGTVIQSHISGKQLPPIRVIKENQALLTFTSKDFSFIEEQVISDLIDALAKANIKINMMQNGAISLQTCVDYREDKMDKIKLLAQEQFFLDIKEGLTLLTIRHYTPDAIQKHTSGKKAYIVQKRPTTYQVLMQ